MKAYPFKIILIAFVLATTLTGCFNVNGEFKAIRNNILNNIDGDFNREIEFGVGSVSMALASAFVSLSDADDYADDILRKVSRIQIGVYEQRGRRGDLEINTSLLRDITNNMRQNGWDYIVRTVEQDEMVMVFIKSDNIESIENLFVISLNDRELVMTELYGDLDEAVNIAIRENGFKFHVARN